MDISSDAPERPGRSACAAVPRARRSQRNGGSDRARPPARSRNGGSRSGTTLRRKNRSSRNRPCWIRIRRSLLVAATMRTSVLIGVRPPTVVYSPCCRTRSSRVCASIGMSPISSRNSVPPSACSKRPDERVLAPVNAPFSCPNNSDSIRSRGIAAMLMATNGPLLPLAVIVQRARHQFLAGPGFAGDHDREIGLHQPRQQTIDFLHRRRAPDQRDRGIDLLGLGELRGLSFGSDKARPTMPISSFRSNGFGRYS